MIENNKTKGNFGEDTAAKELLKKGYEILERNYRTRTGEIDIIAKNRNTVVFVEVKLRHGTDKGMPAEAVDSRKQKKIIDTAMNYIAEKDIKDSDFRFDVIEILVLDKTYLRHTENAFWR